MSRFRPITKVLRRLTLPLRDGFRKRWMTDRIQRAVPLKPEHRTEKRRRMHVLVDLVHEHCPPRDVLVMEVGVRGGRTGSHLLEYCPQITTLWGVDLRRPDPEKSPIWKHDRVRFLQGWSHEAAEQFEDGTFDLVFIDADHSEAAVRADLAAWAPKVKPGGVIAGHDYGSKNHPGVKIAVDDFFRGHPHTVHLDADKVWWTTLPAATPVRGDRSVTASGTAAAVSGSRAGSVAGSGSGSRSVSVSGSGSGSASRAASGSASAAASGSAAASAADSASAPVAGALSPSARTATTSHSPSGA